MSKIKKTESQKDMARAEEVMRTYAQSLANKNALQATIKNELDSYIKNLKEAEAELLELGVILRDHFNVDGNLVLDHGYLHVANSTVVTMGKKFDLAAFAAEHPEMVDVKLKVAPIKKAFLDSDQRKELKAFAVDVTTEETIQIKISEA
jgi:hypothetical protein